MIKLLPRNILRFTALVLVQVLVFNNIQFSGFINPYVYILFILLMPFETPRWLLLFSGMLLGFSVDILSNTLGMHMIATIFMAFLRPFVLQIIAPRDGYEAGSFPRIYFYGFNWFFKYSAILIFAHHLVLFYAEIFEFSSFFHTLLRVILSSIFTLICIVASQYFIFRK